MLPSERRFCYAAALFIPWPDVQSGSITAEIASHDHASSLEAAGPVVANVCTVVAVIFTFPIQLFPSMELLRSVVLLPGAEKTETGIS